MRRFLASLAVLAILLSILLPVAAISAGTDGGITIISNTAKAGFPTSVTFSLEAESAVDIVNISIECQVARRSLVPVKCRADVSFNPSNHVTVMHILAAADIPPGTEITYTWIMEDASGNVVESAPATVRYDDERYEWRSITSGQVTLFWYEGNSSFAQQLMIAAQGALSRLSDDFNASLQQPVKFYIYADAAALQGALVNPDVWTGGIASPAYNTIMIGISEDSIDWGMRAVAHELGHLVVGQIVYSPFGALPMWLFEGTAMNAEGDLVSDFQDRLDRAVSGNSLFSVRSIASSFPADSSDAKLCYAESYSVVRFLTDNYGSEKLLALIGAFKQGSTDDDALRQVYGFDTDGLNEAWRASLGLGPQPELTPAPASTSSDFALTAPYIVMIALVFILAIATVCLGAMLFRKWR
jgi:hypothetical protein